MPSTLVHVAVAGLVGAALLAVLDRRSAAVVLVAGTVPDLDTFVGLVLRGAHRSLLHTLLLPAGLVALVLWDTRLRATSTLRERYGDRGVRLAWAATAALLVGGILPDLFTNGVNAFYPVHDAFYSVNGKALLSNQRGFVQTFVELAPERPAPSTETLHYSTGVDPTPGDEPADVERIFPLAMSGLELMLVLVGSGVVAVRLRMDDRRD
jgi:membrane-bound metal-dependent hydrolase YbcI (DUF457 family)